MTMTMWHPFPVRIPAGALSRVLEAGTATLVSFETSGCPHCAALGPRLDQIADEFAEKVSVFRVVSPRDDASLAARYHLMFMPTVTFWRGGQERSRLTGAVTIQALRSHVRFLAEGGPLPDPEHGPRSVVAAAFHPTRMH